MARSRHAEACPRFPKRKPGGMSVPTAIRLLDEAQRQGWLQTAHTSENFLAAPREATMGSVPL